MAAVLSDEEIADLVAEPKRLPLSFKGFLSLKRKRGHQEADLDVVGDLGSEFRVIVRRSNFNPLDFSVILGYLVPQSNQLIRLRRYNGKSHEHTNPVEGQRFYDFHVHYATERYQRSGNREDTYAETTDRYSTLEGAIECLFADCGFVLPGGYQSSLFGGK